MMKKMSILMLLCVMAGLASAAVVQTSNTLHYWNFDDGTGNDLAGAFDLAAYEGATVATGVANTFDNQATSSGKLVADATGYANLSALSNFIGADGSFTFEAMVKPMLADSGAHQEIICGESDSGTASSRGFQFRIQNDDKTLRFQTLSGSVAAYDAAISYTVGQWYHTAVTFDAASSTLTLYWTAAGGTLAQAGSWGNVVPLNGATMTRFCIGNELRSVSGYGNENFEGWIDEVGIHGTALTAFNTTIPEPTTMTLLGLGVLGLLKRRRA